MLLGSRPDLFLRKEVLHRGTHFKTFRFKTFGSEMRHGKGRSNRRKFCPKIPDFPFFFQIRECSHFTIFQGC